MSSSIIIIIIIIIITIKESSHQHNTILNHSSYPNHFNHSHHFRWWMTCFPRESQARLAGQKLSRHALIAINTLEALGGSIVMGVSQKRWMVGISWKIPIYKWMRTGVALF